MMRLFLSFAALVVCGVAEAISLEKQNEHDGVTVALSPSEQAVSVGEHLRFQYTYTFKKMGFFMNVFALTHNHPSPTGELRIFKEDGSFFAILRAHGFAGAFGDREYFMYENSLLGFSTTLPTTPEDSILPNRIPAGRYRIQLATYDKLWGGFWVLKDRPAEAVLFSNVVGCEVKPSESPK